MKRTAGAQKGGSIFEYFDFSSNRPKGRVISIVHSGSGLV
jgi:hypothetical protein